MEPVSAISGAKALYDSIVSAVKVRDEVRANAALAELYARLIDTMSSAIATKEECQSLQAQLQAAQQEIRDLREELREREQYVLKELRPGAFAYAYRPVGEADAAPAHYRCAQCHNTGVASILRANLAGRVLQCLANPTHNLRLESEPRQPLAGGHGGPNSWMQR